MPHELRSRAFAGFTAWTFEHTDAPLVGVNGAAFVDMEPFVDLADAAALHEEVMLGLFLAQHTSLPGVLGQTPPEFGPDLGFTDYESHVLYTIEAFDPTGEHRRRIERLPGLQERRRYIHHVMARPLPWSFTLYLRRASFARKTAQQDEHPEWQEDARHFPLLRRWIATLPFASVGRVMFFCTDAGKGVPVHRDQVVRPHRDHCINVWFDGPRRAFVYDCATRTKTHLPPTRAYFFNNCDYHGVEPDDRFRYTLRVDGTFTEAVQARLGLVDGIVGTP